MLIFPFIFLEISSLKTTIDQGVAQANQSWNATTGQFMIPSGKNMDWANTIKNSWATRDKRLMEKQLKEYQIYAVIYKDRDGKPKIIWKVTKDGKGVKNPKLYQYLNAKGKEIPSDLFEFISQHDWDEKVKAAFRDGKDLQIGDKYHPALGALVATGQYLEDAYKFMAEDELGQALQMLGFNFASYRLATNKGTKTVENKKASGTKSSGENIFNYTNKVNEHMANPDRAVPSQTLKEAIKGGTPMPDPRGSSATMYYSEIYINGKKYNFEVLYDKATNTIYHFKYDRRPLGPLPAVPKQ